MTKTLASGFVLGLLGLAGCVNVVPDPGETVLPPEGPTVQFDPAASIIPFPNNLVLNPMTGKVNLPAQCGESLAGSVIRTSLLNKLDGFGSYQSAMQVTFSEALDATSLNGHVLLYQRAKGTTANPPNTATAIPVVLIPGTTKQFSADCSTNKPVTSLTIIAQGALDSHATYTTAITKGVKTAAGKDFAATFTWALISQADAPVKFDGTTLTVNKTPLNPLVAADLAQLQGIALLYDAHKAAMDFLAGTGHARADVLVAWEFTTQTTTDVLDPASSGSPAATVTASALSLQATASILGGATPAQFLTAAGLPCGAGGLPCDSIGDIVAGALITSSYQADTSNPLAGGKPVPGAWSDPVRPVVAHQPSPTSPIIAFASVPAGTAPANGWPTVVFGHGLTGSKTNMFAIAPQLAQAGFAAVAIDFVAHGSRAIQTSNDAARGCAGTPDPSRLPQCFAQFLSSDLAGTRDNIRQSILDIEALVAAVKACGIANCGALKVDPAHLTYMGISLGGILGSTVVASIADFKGAVLNVPGVGLLDILENTANLGIRCGLVDALIAVGVVVGQPFNPGNPPAVPPSGACLTDAWKAQAGYQTFSVAARWVLDPADGANFTRKLATRKILIQEVVNDQVVPNIATDRQGALVGLTAGNADPQVGLTPAPSGVITTNPTANKFVKYRNLAPTASPPFPGNTFAHPTLLAPATTVLPPVGDPPAPPACDPATGVACDGLLGTLRVQTDAITFLTVNH